VGVLASALERFSRKERILLVRKVLGHEDKPLQLSDGFRGKVASELQIDGIPSDAWWATDYHLECSPARSPSTPKERKSGGQRSPT
jgi:hypothetical protein